MDATADPPTDEILSTSLQPSGASGLSDAKDRQSENDYPRSQSPEGYEGLEERSDLTPLPGERSRSESTLCPILNETHYGRMQGKTDSLDCV